MSEALIRHSLGIIRKAQDMGAGRVAVKISGGKDSTVLTDMIMRSGISACFIHQYIVPGMRIEEDVLEALEKRFGIEIIRIAHPRRGEMFNCDVLCINKIWDEDASRKFTHGEANDRFIAAIAKTPWMATGIRKQESITRHLSLTKHPNPHPRNHRMYPLADWPKSEIFAHIKANGLPLSKAYALFGRSMSSYNIAHLYPLKQGIPEDYEKFCHDFPLMRCLVWLYEKRAREFGVTKLPKC